ncbi:BglG family transcription antiterminator [Streptococcus halichoeri]|uniref:BglG family transcription antiterminator n=1 Tax=Streptococcus halichoeri TaxID=254785 RepID=UPI00135C86DD|nr:transcription antiterminator [Streptococcus halichoeri]
MMLLDNKSYDLLTYLIKLEQAETIMGISQQLGQSRRKIYYHLDKINEALPADIVPVAALPRVGICLTERQKAACRSLLADVDDYNYVMKSDERVKLAALFIAVSTDRVTIDRLMQINDVSRNTVLNDLNDLRLLLIEKPYSISLQVTKARGYFFECHPLSFIQFLYHLLDGVYRGGNSSFQACLQLKLSKTLTKTIYFSPELLAFLKDYLPISQANLGKTINASDYQFMIKILPFILLSYRNMAFSSEFKETLQQEFDRIWKRKEYYIARDLADELAVRFNLILDHVEIGLIAMLMLSFRKDKDEHAESSDYQNMRTDLTNFLRRLEDKDHLHFTHKADLIRQLTTHCKALIYRKEYGITAMNPLTNHIKEKYLDLFEKTKAAVPLLEEAWHIELTDDDIADITIHLGGELRNSSAKPECVKMIIVSDAGIGLQKLLHKQCEFYLVNSQTIGIFTTEQFQSVSDLLNVDFVVTTHPDLECSLPTLVVNPILTDDDILNLLRYAKHQQTTKPQVFSQMLEKLIGQYVASQEDGFALKSQIEKLIRQELMQDLLEK